ncbi:hypothetical protein PVAP13_8KG386100 [Panicum virgatum]|uniref:Uncharacterized protein n=1 Tax=Panicum virgatum TaxID=38727 RepID=A0A8T0PUV9_PANVG|nr:hypothetical protein PVAP13_8KG386100 [Panicum virgatum]
MGHTGRELKQTQQEEEMSSLGWGSRRGGNKHSEHLPTQMLHRRTRMPNQATRGVMSSGCLRGHTWRLQALNPGDSTAHSSLI